MNSVYPIQDYVDVVKQGIDKKFKRGRPGKKVVVVGAGLAGLSAAYELMKVDDPRTRRRLAAQVATGELSLVKLRQRIEGRPSRPEPAPDAATEADVGPATTREPAAIAVEVGAPGTEARPGTEDTASMDIDEATEHLSRAVNELATALRADPALAEASATERQQFAKSLTITKIKLENAIAVVRAGGPRVSGGGSELRG